VQIYVTKLNIFCWQKGKKFFCSKFFDDNSLFICLLEWWNLLHEECNITFKSNDVRAVFSSNCLRNVASWYSSTVCATLRVGILPRTWKMLMR